MATPGAGGRDGAAELRVSRGLVCVFDEPLRPGELNAADAVAVYRGEEPNATAGFDVATCDTDRDGRDELLVGAPVVDGSADARDAGAFYWLDDVPSAPGAR